MKLTQTQWDGNFIQPDADSNRTIKCMTVGWLFNQEIIEPLEHLKNPPQPENPTKLDPDLTRQAYMVYKP